MAFDRYELYVLMIVGKMVNELFHFRMQSICFWAIMRFKTEREKLYRVRWLFARDGNKLRYAKCYFYDIFGATKTDLCFIPHFSSRRCCCWQLQCFVLLLFFRKSTTLKTFCLCYSGAVWLESLSRVFSVSELNSLIFQNCYPSLRQIPKVFSFDCFFNSSLMQASQAFIVIRNLKWNAINISIFD